METNDHILALVRLFFRCQCLVRDLCLFTQPNHVGILFRFLYLLSNTLKKIFSPMWIITEGLRLRKEMRQCV